MHNANPETIADCIVQSRSGGRVERCHGLPHLGTYSNATHQWGVAMLMHYIWPDDFPRLALVCLTHDVPEAWVGDIPAPTCRYTPGLKESLSAAEGNINKDLLLPAEDELDPLTTPNSSAVTGWSSGCGAVSRSSTATCSPRRARRKSSGTSLRFHCFPRQRACMRSSERTTYCPGRQG
jgi:hypothetical protein